MTLFVVAILSSGVALLMLGAFAASGFWMVLGSIWRHMRRREKSIQAVIDEANGLAEQRESGA